MEKLRECRERKGLSQKQVALEIGVKPPTVSQWESGIKIPSRENIVKLANLFDVTVDYLLGISEDVITKNQPPAKGEGLKEKVLSRLDSLTPQELQRVDDFLSGIQSAHKEP